MSYDIRSLSAADLRAWRMAPNLLSLSEPPPAPRFVRSSNAIPEEAAVADIREHMKIIGKDGAQVGTVDRVEGSRIKLTKKDSPTGHQGHHHYIDLQLVGAVEGDIVKLSVNADAIPEYETEQSGQKV
jgi:hypothetical protein